MTPEPTPVSGMTPLLVSTLLDVVMRTTAGLTLAATAMVADDSSMLTGWLPLTVEPLAATGLGVGWSRAPVADRARTVPPEARTADRAAARTTEPVLDRLARPAEVVGAVTGVVAAVAAAGAGSYQRSGVTAGAVAVSWRDQTGRGSGVGEKDAGVTGVIGEAAAGSPVSGVV